MNCTSWFYLELLGASGHMLVRVPGCPDTVLLEGREDTLGLLQRVGLQRLHPAASLSQPVLMPKCASLHPLPLASSSREWTFQVSVSKERLTKFFFETEFRLVTQAGVQWRNLGSLPPPPPGCEGILLPQPLE